MEFSISASALNTVATGAYYSNKSGCFASVKRKTKKAVMKNVKCVVLSDVYRNRIFNDLYTTDENLKLLNLEKLFEITFNNETVKALRRMRVEDYDIYLSLTIKALRQLLERYRNNNNLRTNLYLFVSSVKLARQLGISKKNICVFIPATDDDLKDYDEKIQKYHKIQDSKNDKNFSKVKYSFESYQGLLNQIKKIVPGVLEHNKEEALEEALKEILIEDTIDTAEKSDPKKEDIGQDEESKGD
jgi:hypothetical protein